MSGLQDQLRRVGVAAREVIGSSWSGTQRAGNVARDRAAEAVEQALDAIFDEPLDVPDAQAARRMTAEAWDKPSVLWPILEGLAALRLTRWVSRFSRFGVAAAVGAAADAAVHRVRRAVNGGLVELRVLASLLASRARSEGVNLDKDEIRAVTVEVYLHPFGNLDLRYRGVKAGRAVATRWAKDAASNIEERSRRELAESRIDAIERLDVRGLAQRWQSQPMDGS